ncbi:leucine-rich repeat protein [Parabacteroides goldsteinii]|uniref:BACON domain-containing protein n=1 Tax=Parabacteroides goldsteinii TaxID=328812 RepID=UPI001CCF4EB0|nr:BACON domain-containing carbohydrate-binding protein [Parabacteroides goldsteinii]UBD75394.1 leucine-rich repeat protein [Parabacteroides goldsteinii]
MKHIKRLTTILLIALLLAGCQEELPHSARIEAGKENLSFAQVTGAQTVKVTTSHAWTAVSSGSWLTVSPDSGGAGTYELTLTAAANTSTVARSAQVDIQVGHKISTIKVSQAQQDVLGLDRNSAVVAWPAGSVEFTLATNKADYEVASDAAWLKPSATKAVKEEKLLLAYDENPTYDARTATVTVSSGTLSSKVTVTQGGRGALYFVISRDTVGAADTRYELSLMKNTTSNGLRLLDKASWITMPPRSKAVPTEERIRLTLQPNTKTEPRKARLVINDSSTGALLTDTFTLVQRGRENVLLPEIKSYEAAVAGETFDIPVVASGPFEVELPKDAPWLTGSTGVQLGGTLRFKVEENTRPEARTAVIVLRLQSDVPVEATITVTQAAAKVTDTELIPRLYNLLEGGVVIETVPVNLGAFRATIDYDAGEPSNWVHDIYSSGGKLHFRVDDNSATAKRSAVIHLAPEDKEPVEIRINQSGTEGAYIELNRPGTLASFIDFSKMDRYKSIRLVSQKGINADDINTLRNKELAVEEINLAGVAMVNLPESAFEGNRTLQKITLPERLLSVGNAAFAGSRLKELKYSGARVLQVIGDRAFEGCSGLKMDNIFISSLQSIGERAFAGAFTESESNDLDLVGASGLRTIGKDAFRACNTLTKLTLPVNLSQIGEGAFSECYNLAGTLDLPESLTTIGAEAFYNCKNLTGMLVLPVSLRELGDRAFMRCAALGGLDLSNCRLTEIGVEVFKESLSSLSTSVDKLEVPSGVTFIAASAFEDTGFREVDLPATLAMIGRRAFYNCRKLSIVTSRRTGVVPVLDAEYPAETFGGVDITGQRTLKVNPQAKKAYQADPLWIKATPEAGGNIVWTIEDI